MSGFICPRCGERVNLFKTGGGTALAKEANVPFLGEIPIDPEIVTSGDSGRPFVLETTLAPGGMAFAGVVSMILESQDNTGEALTVEPISGGQGDGE
jgi:hypothetical protein